MEEKFFVLKEQIRKLCDDKKFRHSKWFFKYHLEIVERISLELCEKYEKADKGLVMLIVWMHDYEKIVDLSEQNKGEVDDGVEFLVKIGFERELSEKVVDYIKILDRKENIQEAEIEIQIVSSADGASHLVGPFYCLWWYENPSKSFEDLMADNKAKALKDWNKKVVIPEIREAFGARHRFQLEQCGEFSEKYLS